MIMILIMIRFVEHNDGTVCWMARKNHHPLGRHQNLPTMKDLYNVVIIETEIIETEAF